MNKISLVKRRDVINQYADYVASKKLIPIFELFGMKGFTDAKKLCQPDILCFSILCPAI